MQPFSGAVGADADITRWRDVHRVGQATAILGTQAQGNARSRGVVPCLQISRAALSIAFEGIQPEMPSAVAVAGIVQAFFGTTRSDAHIPPGGKKQARIRRPSLGEIETILSSLDDTSLIIAHFFARWWGLRF